MDTIVSPCHAKYRGLSTVASVFALIIDISIVSLLSIASNRQTPCGWGEQKMLPSGAVVQNNHLKAI
jgi:hypothetical protein